MRKNIFCLLVLMLITSCLNKNNPVVLKVGNHNIRHNELSSSFNRFSLYFENNSERKIDRSAFDLWITEFINNILLEDKAKSLGYNEDNRDIQIAQSTCMKYLIAQFQGPYYQETTSNRVTASEEEMNEALDKIKYLFTFEVLKFSDKNQLSNILGTDTLFRYHNDFVRIKGKVMEKGISSSEIKDTWPFMKFPGMKDTLFKMTPGMVIPGPVLVFDTPYKDAFYVIYLKSKVPIKELFNNPPSIENMRPVVREYKKLIMFYTKLRDFYQKADFKIKQTLVDSLFQQIKYLYGLNKIDTNNMQVLLDRQILTYKLNNKPVKVTIRDFAAFYNNLLIRIKIKDTNDLAEFIQDMVIFDYFWEEAEQSGYTSREFFIISQHEHLRENIIQVYLEKDVYPSINITEEEIEKAYNGKISDFTDGEFAIFNICIFKDMMYAMQCKNVLRNENPDKAFMMLEDTSKIKGLILCKKVQELRYDSRTYPDYIMGQLFRLERGQATEPFILHDKPALLVKIGEKGTHVSAYFEVKDALYNSLLFEKQMSAKNKLIADLRKDCKIVNKVDYNKYVVENINIDINPIYKEK